MTNYIIGSGWFSDIYNKTELGKVTEKHQRNYGGKTSRNSDF